MKRFLLTFLALAGACFLYAAIPTPPDEIPPGGYYVWESSVSIYEEPAFDSYVIGTLDRDDRLTVLSACNDEEFLQDYLNNNFEQWWYRIETADGLYGYIYGKYIAKKRIALDVDENGITDYFYITHGARGLGDIYIFINYEKIDDRLIWNTVWQQTKLDNRTNRWIDADFLHFQYSENGRVTADIRLTGKDYRTEIEHSQIMTVELTKVMIANSEKMEMPEGENDALEPEKPADAAKPEGTPPEIIAAIRENVRNDRLKTAAIIGGIAGAAILGFIAGRKSKKPAASPPPPTRRNISKIIAIGIFSLYIALIFAGLFSGHRRLL